MLKRNSTRFPSPSFPSKRYQNKNLISLSNISFINHQQTGVIILSTQTMQQYFGAIPQNRNMCIKFHSFHSLPKCVINEPFTLPETDIAQENLPSQKENSIPTIHFQVRTVSFQESNNSPKLISDFENGTLE